MQVTSAPVPAVIFLGPTQSPLCNRPILEFQMADRLVENDGGAARR
jgi:hypothetical protein